MVREHPILAAARRRNTGRAPVWIMRQAGRYLEEYRALRAAHSFKELCESPQLATEVSLLPHRILDVDAVIVFSDILIPLEKMGAPLVYTDAGPVFSKPLREEADLDRLGPLDPPRHTPAILETIGRVKEALGDGKPVLGFGGAPFTLAAYLVEGELGKSGDGIRRALHRSPGFVHRLLDLLSTAAGKYLDAQAGAGAHAVQLFDTWAGLLTPRDYREFALPYQKRVFEAIRPGVPRILYVNGGDHVLEEMAAAGADVVSVDWRGDLDRARARLGPGVALQGNLDPAALFAPPDRVRARVRAMLEGRRGDPAYIVNLGHGILPDTPLESAKAMVDECHRFAP
jgi:uroporphyrinogen decarboxylase